MKNERKVLSVG